MRRREFIRLVGGAAAWPLAARAQETRRVYRLGILSPSTPIFSILVAELAKLHFVEGENLAIEARSGDPKDFPDAARDLVLGKPDVIVAVSTALVAVRAVTQTIPIVAFGPDPVAQGFAQSLSRPGGNVTGILILAAELDGKRLELLNEAVPAKKLAVLVHASAPSAQQSRELTNAAASRLGIEALVLQTGGPNDYLAAFAAIRAAGVRSVVITANAWFYRDRDLLLRLASESGLATICEWGDMAASGCLIGYGPRRLELYRRSADLVARIFRGAQPADLPVEQPAHFDLVINLNTANALSLTIPPSLLARADEVIE